MTKWFFIAATLLSHENGGQNPRIVKLPELQQVMAESSPDIHIINFWATWCAPCVKELPMFEKITADENPAIKVTLVSMDLDLDPNPEKVYKFVALKRLRSQVLLLDEPNPNEWINKIEPQWSGALPATVIINNKTGKTTLHWTKFSRRRTGTKTL